MNQSLANLEMKVLEKMYLKETSILKLKLLSGAFKKNTLKQKNKAIELALAIHLKQFGSTDISNALEKEYD